MKTSILCCVGFLVVWVSASLVAAAPLIPTSYDPRNSSLAVCISPALDQGSCGSCFAFAAASVFSDRLCIAFGPNGSPAGNRSYVSPQDALSCSHEGGCHGGRAIDVWQNLYATNGARTCTKLCNSGCYPYTSGSGCRLDLRKNGCASCRTTCSDTGALPATIYYSNSSQAGFVTTYGGLSMQDAIRREIIQNGPVAAVMRVYGNFQSYYQQNPQGVYTSTQNSRAEGSHAIRIIGWGESMEKDMDSGQMRLVPWWIISNSWGENWGMNGFFRMERGKNLVGIEDKGSIFAGCPNNAAPKCVLTFPLSNKPTLAHMGESGGWEHIDSTKSDVLDFGRAQLLRKLSNSAVGEWKLTSVESQIVAGVNYRLTFALAAVHAPEDSIQIVIHRNMRGDLSVP